MMPRMHVVWPPARVLIASAMIAASACAPAPHKPAADRCQHDSLSTIYKGVLTIGTDQPVYPPWYIGDNPANGEGFEAALAYAAAARLGYQKDSVRWVRVPFNAALGPGSKGFDAGLAEFSITEQRKAAVDFSSPYYDVTQAVVTEKSSPAAAVHTLDGLKPLRLGAQVGSTSYSAAASLGTRVPIQAYNTNSDAKLALSRGEIDAVVLDLPTAFAVADELRNGLIVGQLPMSKGNSEQFGVVLAKGSPLTACVSYVVDEMKANGTLATLERQWLAGAGKAPVLN
jgi:polar amino acid transport system substrate-binding protein